MGRLRKAAALAELLLDSTPRRAAIQRRAFSLTAFTIVRRLIAAGLRPRVIIDGGANIGQFSRAARAYFPDADIIAFEPLPDVAATYRRNMKGVPGVTLYELALGDREEDTWINQHAYSLSSSLLDVTDSQIQSFATGASSQRVRIRTARLDQVLAGPSLPRPILLKLDLQGYEKPALIGATGLLPFIDHVLIEASFYEMYRGEALFEELQMQLREWDFVFHQPIDFLEDRGGRLVQMDALFQRQNR